MAKKPSINDFRCPCCRARIPLESLINDALWGGIFRLYARFERAIQGRLFPYLRLFETGKRSLLLIKAEEILESLVLLVEPGTVRWEHNEERPAPGHVWSAALDKVLARRPKDLKNHNYLRVVAYEDAAPLAVSAEAGMEKTRQAKRSRLDEAEPESAGGGDEAGDPQAYKLLVEGMKALVKSGDQASPKNTCWNCGHFFGGKVCKESGVPRKPENTQAGCGKHKRLH